MRPGPPPKPTKFRIISGNAAHRPLNKGEPQPDQVELEPESQTVQPPTELKARARQIWDLMVPALAKLGLLTVCDTRALARYCDLFVRYEAARDFLDKHGETYPVHDYYRDYDAEAKIWTTKKRLKGVANFPQVKNYLAYTRELLRLENEMGLTPSARSRINVQVFGGKGNTSPLGAYLESNPKRNRGKAQG